MAVGRRPPRRLLSLPPAAPIRLDTVRRMSTNISSRRRFAALAQRQLRAGPTKAAELGLLGVRVSEVDPPYVTTADGRRLINYASCCYLETATRPEIIAASQKAAAAYGTQLSLSPTYMALDL